MGLAVVLSALPGPLGAALGQLVGVVCVAVTFRAARRQVEAGEARPWMFFGAAGAVFLIGNVVRAVHGAVVGVPAPFPSPADLLYLLGYGLLIAGQVDLIRRRRADVEGDNAIDSLILAAALGILLLVFVLLPTALDANRSTLNRALTAAYTVADLGLLGGVTRLAVSSAKRSRSWYLLAAAWVTMVGVDLYLGVTDSTSGPLPLAAFLPFILVALAATDPSMTSIGDPAPPREVHLTSRRLLVLCSALLLVPGLLLVPMEDRRRSTVVVIALGSMVLSVLVVGRLAGLVRAKEHKAARERSLRAVSAKLVASTSAEAMRTAALEASEKLFARPGWRPAALLLSPGPQPAVMACRGPGLPHPGTPVRIETSVQRHPGGVMGVVVCWDGSDPGQSLAVLTAAVPLQAPSADLGTLLVTTPAVLRLDAALALRGLADQLALGLASAALTEEVQRRRQERRFRALIEHSSDLVMVVGLDGMVSFASPAATRLLGRRPKAMVGRTPFEWVHADDRATAAGLLGFTWAGQHLPEPVELRLEHGEGTWRWFELVAGLLQDEEGGSGPPEGAAGIVLNARDVHDRKTAELRLTNSEARFRSLVQHGTDLVVVIDGAALVTWVSPSATAILGLVPSSLAGHYLPELIHPAEAMAAAYLFSGNHPGVSRRGEVRLRHADGSWRVLDVTATDLLHDPAVQGTVVNARDISERKVLEEELRYKALHDDLTGLASRSLFTDRLQHALAGSDGTDGTVAVLFIDCDDFKTVNDGLGHHVGDDVLVIVADRVRFCLRAEDTAARLGGDEFAVLIEGDGAAARAAAVAHRLLAEMARPMKMNGRTVSLSASIGIAVNSEHDREAGELLRNADVAMYLAKSRGKNRAEHYEAGLRDTVFERLQLKADLARGVEHREFAVVYQPIVDLASGRTIGVEALVRWHHPEHGLVGPSGFVALAEETGLIVPIGNFVLDEACRQLRAWLDLGIGAQLSLNVNISARQLEQPGFADLVSATLRRWGVRATVLTLELTETLLAGDLHQQVLASLRERGVRIGIDDFGTGYSSFNYLSRLPADVLKLDRSFVSPLGTSGQDTDLVRAILDVAASRGLTVIAEGIETVEQLAVLTLLGCRAGQGYHFMAPVSPAEMTAALMTSQRDRRASEPLS